MSTLVRTTWLSQILQHLPSAWLAALDAWSYRVAMRHREKRKRAAMRRRFPAPILYRLKPWRD